VHARTLLVTIPEPDEVVAEMVRLAKPGGWVASQEPDMEALSSRPAIRAVPSCRTS
jgi:ubiquinone/menaquinone biosynthesis C-methylase UbiE